jgi:hypothetical protein
LSNVVVDQNNTTTISTNTTEDTTGATIELNEQSNNGLVKGTSDGSVKAGNITFLL